MKSDTNVSFAANLQRLMRMRKVNDVQLARKTGLSHTAIANYKRGRLPKVDALHKLAAYFDVALDDLLHGAETGLALRIAATVADQHPSARIEERQGKFEAVTGELLGWKTRAAAAEGKLAKVQATLAALMADLKRDEERRTRLGSPISRPARSSRR